MELWSEPILKKLLKQIRKLIKIDIDSKEVTKGRLARVCVEVDITKPLNMELKYKRENVIKTARIDHENITDICYGCGHQNHKFENRPLFPKSLSIEKRKRLEFQ